MNHEAVAKGKNVSAVPLTGEGRDAAEPEAPVLLSAENDLEITEKPDVGVYEATLDGVTVAGVVYSRTGDRVNLLATSVFPEFRGKGIAARVLAGVLDRFRESGADVIVSCPFATAFVRSHPEYADVITDDGRPARQRH